MAAATAEDIQDAYRLVHKAIEAFRNQQLSQANLLLQDAVLSYDGVSTEPVYLFTSGLVHAAAGRLGSAETFFLEAARIDPKGSNALEELGHFYLRLGRYREAGRCLMRAQTLKQSAGREDVYVFGDSHAQSNFGAIARCKVKWLGAVTMHRIGRDGLGVLDFRQLGVPDGVSVILTFGEIDVRAHVLRQRDEKGRQINEVIETLATRFIACLQANAACYQGLRIAFCSILPPTNRIARHAHDLYGSLQDRRMVTEQLNARIRALCGEAGFAYIDVHQYFRDWDGYLNRAYADSNVHAAPELYELVEYEMTRTLGLPLFGG